MGDLCRKKRGGENGRLSGVEPVRAVCRRCLIGIKKSELAVVESMMNEESERESA